MTSFSAFSSYSFSQSQQPNEKYAIAHAFLDAAERPKVAYADPFPPFDIRMGSAKRLVAYWVTLAHLLRCKGSGILVPLHNQALQDSASRAMLWTLFSRPPSARDYRRIVAPAKAELLQREAARHQLIRRMTLEIFWGKDVLRCLPPALHAAVQKRSDEFWQQEILEPHGEGRPSSKFAIAPDADEVEIGAACHFLARVFQGDGMWGTEGYLLANERRWRGEPAPIADAFLVYALDRAGRTWCDKAGIREEIKQREKSLHAELKRRLDALEAGFIYLLEHDTNPDSLLARMSSFWPDDLFADYREAQRFLEEGGA